ncbi:MAG: hypothetical protein WCC87_01945 [Candidatus Korobacteraceae bacterium]
MGNPNSIDAVGPTYSLKVRNGLRVTLIFRPSPGKTHLNSIVERDSAVDREQSNGSIIRLQVIRQKQHRIAKTF